MRKVSLLIVFTCVVCSAFTQFGAGGKIIGGGLSFNAHTVSSSNPTPLPETRVAGVALSFSVSRFSTPLSLNGFGVAYGYTHQYNPASSTFNRHSIGAFFQRTKLQPIAARWYLSFTGNVLTQYQTENSDVTAFAATRSRGFQVGVSGALGIWYQASSRFVFSCDLNNLLQAYYSHQKVTQEQNTGVVSYQATSNDFIVNTGLNGFSLSYLSIGVRYLLKK